MTRTHLWGRKVRPRHNQIGDLVTADNGLSQLELEASQCSGCSESSSLSLLCLVDVTYGMQFVAIRLRT